MCKMCYEAPSNVRWFDCGEMKLVGQRISYFPNTFIAVSRIGLGRADKGERTFWLCIANSEDVIPRRIAEIYYCPFCGKELGTKPERRKK